MGLSHYGVCRLFGLLPYRVCRITGFVTCKVCRLLDLLLYGVCGIYVVCSLLCLSLSYMGFVACCIDLSPYRFCSSLGLSHYGVCRLLGL